VNRNSIDQEKNSRAESLRDIPLFAGLAKEKIQQLEKSCRWCDFLGGEEIISQGDDSRDVYLIVSGNVHVLNFSKSGRVVNFAVLNRGDFFGELAAIDGQRRSATVVAKSLCRMVALSHRIFLNLVVSDPKITLAVLNKLAGVVRMADERITNTAALGAKQMVCVELLNMVVPDPAFDGNFDHLVIYPVPTQNSMASKIGVTRETVTRIFAILYGEGIIEKKDKTLYIRKKAVLEALALAIDQ
jgi:CRP-like cAMP-binding protein